MSADKVKEIAKNCFTDAVEALGIIEVLTAANNNGATQKLNSSGAGRAAAHIQRALFTRLHMIIARHYLHTRPTDLTGRKVFEVLSEPKTQESIYTDQNKADFEEAHRLWAECNKNADLDSYIHLRHKFLAHLAEPDPSKPIPTYGMALKIARDTVDCFAKLANATGIATLDIKTQIPVETKSAKAFWEPWVPKQKDTPAKSAGVSQSFSYRPNRI